MLIKSDAEPLPSIGFDLPPFSSEPSEQSSSPSFSNSAGIHALSPEKHVNSFSPHFLKVGKSREGIFTIVPSS
jgi:hypothetical protein